MTEYTSYWMQASSAAHNKSGYTDHMNDPDGDYMAASDIMRKTQQKAAGGANSSGSSPTTMDQSFPIRLHYMLNEVEGDGLAHVVSWAPHGRAFVVHNPKVFTEQVLGNWFRMSKYASFQRQLNIYGFQRLTTGPEKGGYFHELFLRTKPGLAYRIQRQKVKGTGTRKAAVPELEPDFYHMQSLPPNKTSQCWTQNIAVHPQQPGPGPKVGVQVVGSQVYCSASTTSTATSPIAPSASGVTHCSLASLAPFLLSEKKQPHHPAPRPSITTGFSVYSTGAATAHSKPQQQQQQQHPRSPFTQGFVAPSTGPTPRNSAGQQSIITALTSPPPTLVPAPPLNPSTTNHSHSHSHATVVAVAPYPAVLTTPVAALDGPAKPRGGATTGYVGLKTAAPALAPAPAPSTRSRPISTTPYVYPLVQPLLPKNPSIMQGCTIDTAAAAAGKKSQSLFTSILSATSPRKTGPTATSGASIINRTTAVTRPDYELPLDFSFAGIPSFM